MPLYQGTRGTTETEARLRHQRNEAQAQLRQAQLGGGNLDAYKARVKAKAIEVAAEQGWCNDGLNAALEDLDIARASRDLSVTVTYEMVIHLDEFEGDDDDAENEATNKVEGILNREAVVRDYDFQESSIDEQ